jgi:hypothetical protein
MARSTNPILLANEPVTFTSREDGWRNPAAKTGENRRARTSSTIKSAILYALLRRIDATPATSTRS